MKKIVAIVLCFCMVFMLTSCGKINGLVKDIDEFATKEVITQEELDALFEIYNSLSEEDKEKITNYNILEKYENVDIEKVNELQKEISHISNTSGFSDAIKLYEKYEAMNTNEQNLVEVKPIEEIVKLTNMEKAAVSACQYIKKSLKSSNSFKLNSVKVIDDIGKKSNYYLVNIGYSATNGFGATIDETSFQTISSEFENPWYPLAILNGDYSSALKCTTFIQFYLLNEQEPTEIDCEKVLYYIEEDVKE